MGAKLIPLMSDIKVDLKTGKVDWKSLRREIEDNFDALAKSVVLVPASASSAAVAVLTGESKFRTTSVITKTATTLEEQAIFVNGHGSRDFEASFWVPGRVVSLFLPSAYTLVDGTTLTLRIRIDKYLLFSATFVQRADSAVLEHRIYVDSVGPGIMGLNRFSSWSSAFDQLDPADAYVEGSFTRNKTLSIQVTAQFSVADSVSTFSVRPAEMLWQPEPVA